MVLVDCAICKKPIDRSSCNQTYGILTTVKDSDETGTKKTRKYFCNNCLNDIEEYIMFWGDWNQ